MRLSASWDGTSEVICSKSCFSFSDTVSAILNLCTSLTTLSNGLCCGCFSCISYTSEIMNVTAAVGSNQLQRWLSTQMPDFVSASKDLS